MTNMLAKAISIAALCHEGQTDKGGKAYILHPIRMMMRLRTDDEELMCMAILHDVIEDCEITPEILYDNGMSDRVVAGVVALSRLEHESYDEFIERCALNPDAKIIKREDLRDNSDITRLKGLRKKDFDRLAKYSRAYTRLME